MKDIKSKLTFENYIVNSVDFKNNIEYNDDRPVKIDFDIDSEVHFLDDNHFLLELAIEVFRDAEKNNYPFNFKANIMGKFEIFTNNEEEKNKLAEQNSVAILFPYVRALISTYTSASNVSPIILPPINVVKYLEEKRKRTGN